MDNDFEEITVPLSHDQWWELQMICGPGRPFKDHHEFGIISMATGLICLPCEITDLKDQGGIFKLCKALGVDRVIRLVELVRELEQDS